MSDYLNTNAHLEGLLSMRDVEIADLKVVSDHNLHIYQEAASKLRAEIADLNNRLAFLGEIASTHVGEKEKLRKQVNKLLFAVERKFPNESRFETALRYIREAELNANEALAATEQKP